MRRKKLRRTRNTPLKRTPLARRTPLLSKRLGLVSSSRISADPNVELPRVFREAAFRRSSGLCVVSGQPADDAHHVIPKQSLRKLVSTRARQDGLGQTERREFLGRILWDVRNGVAVSRVVHDRHTKAVERIPRSALPKCAIEFAQELGLLWMIERDYPERTEET